MPVVSPETMSKYSKEEIDGIQAGMTKGVDKTKANGTFTTLPFAVFMGDMSITPRFVRIRLIPLKLI